jgi:hypothetical protein
MTEFNDLGGASGLAKSRFFQSQPEEDKNFEDKKFFAR